MEAISSKDDDNDDSDKLDAKMDDSGGCDKVRTGMNGSDIGDDYSDDDILEQNSDYFPKQKCIIF